MRRFLNGNRVGLLLGMNVGILLLILLAVVMRDGREFPSSAAFGQSLPMSSAGSAWINGMTIMPGQLSANVWGCFVMDAENHTLSVYQYSPGDQSLKFAAGRDIQYDRQLKLFNTSPKPSEIKAMLDRANEPSRAAPTTNRSPE